MEYKQILGLSTIVLGIVSYGFYFHSIFKKYTRPHAITWLIWAVLNGVMFVSQQSNGAAAGSWITGMSAVAACLIFVLAVVYGEKSVTALDWYCMLGALVSMLFWLKFQHGIGSVLLASMTFTLGFIPTFRKSFTKPGQEPTLTFALNGLKFLIALYALGSFTIVTALYPAVVASINFGFVGYVVYRRSKVRNKHKTPAVPQTRKRAMS